MHIILSMWLPFDSLRRSYTDNSPVKLQKKLKYTEGREGN